MEKLDVKAVETAAKVGFERHKKIYGEEDLETSIVDAIVAAITEYDRQREN